MPLNTAGFDLSNTVVGKAQKKDISGLSIEEINELRKN